MSNAVTTREYELLHPVILLYIDFKGLIGLKALNKRYRSGIEDEKSHSIGFWPAVCNSFCFYAGLYSPIIYNPEFIYDINYRKHFFDELWPLKQKWSIQSSNDSSSSTVKEQSYKVKVVCRFRPGETPEGKVCLPLHQFLKLKRQQKALAQEGGGLSASQQESLLVGEKEPEEFLDPFLGSLMKEPVLLKTSNQICDRSVALQCILRGGRDPFNNRKLTQSMLLPQPELAMRIEQWKQDKEQRKDHNIAVDLKDTKCLLDNHSGFSNDLLEALLEIERIQRNLKKAQDGDSNNKTQRQQWQEEGNEEMIAVVAPEQDEENMAGNEEQENQVPNFSTFPNQQQPPQDPFVDYRFLNNQQRKHQSKKNEVAKIVEVNPQQNYVAMHIPGSGIRPFHYSKVHTATVKQAHLYESSIQSSIASVLNGCNACIMCYGQTGSGKTFTFLGPEGCLEELPLQGEDNDDRVMMLSNAQKKAFNHQAGKEGTHQASLAMMDFPSLGIVLRTTEDLFLAQKSLLKYHISMTIGIQMVEIYEEKATDLLTGKKVTVRRDTGSVTGPVTMIHNQQEFLKHLKLAHSHQKFAETSMNKRSSRSHTIFIFHITQQQQQQCHHYGHGQGQRQGQAKVLLQSQLHLVDLAGSERIKKSQVSGIHVQEAIGINSSLLVLGKVITSLMKGKSHIPYFESKLTTVLKSAFGGNAHTTVIVNTRYEETHGDETLQTLRFGERCAQISNVLKQLASSYEDTLEIMTHSLTTLQQQIRHFQQTNKTHLITYQTLIESYSNLERKRNELMILRQQSQPQVVN